MVQAIGIHLSFETQVLFEDLSFKVTQGTHACLRADSGRGKSTILKLLQGYVLPRAGTVVIDGISLGPETAESIRSVISWVPQNVYLPVANGNALLELLQMKDRKAIAVDYLNGLGLDENALTKDFSKISGGEKQRVILAICLSREKPIVLLDEPTAALDASATERLIELVHSLRNTTILSASHDDQWVATADQVIDL